MFILDKRQQIFRFGLLQKRKRRGLHLLGHLLDDPLGVLFAQRFHQQRFGVFKPAFGNPVVCQRDVVKLIAHITLGAGTGISPG